MLGHEVAFAVAGRHRDGEVVDRPVASDRMHEDQETVLVVGEPVGARLEVRDGVHVLDVIVGGVLAGPAVDDRLDRLGNECVGCELDGVWPRPVEEEVAVELSHQPLVQKLDVLEALGARDRDGVVERGEKLEVQLGRPDDHLQLLRRGNSEVLLGEAQEGGPVLRGHSSNLLRASSSDTALSSSSCSATASVTGVPPTSMTEESSSAARFRRRSVSVA